MRYIHQIFRFLLISVFSFLFLVDILAVGQSQSESSSSGTHTAVMSLDPTDKADWLKWRPKWEDVESFTAKVDLDSNATDALVDATFTFTLKDTSKYPGYCMNAGDINDTSYDIIFEREYQDVNESYTYTVSDDKQKLTVACNGPVNKVDVVVFVKDYGAHAILEVSVALEYEEPQSPSDAKDFDEDADDSIAIPLDNNGNDIADGWQDDENTNYNPWDDEELGPAGDAFPGDGYTVFEEYRGFMVKGKHSDELETPVSPTQIDLFVHSEFEADGYALGYATNLPESIIIHLIDWEQMNPPIRKAADGTEILDDDDNLIWLPNPCVMNSRSCGDVLQVVQQRAIWINKNPKIAGSYISGNGMTHGIGYGIADSETGLATAIHQIRGVQIFAENIKGIRDKTVKAMKKLEPKKTLPADALDVVIKRTIGQELGHAIGLYHPWEYTGVVRERGTQQTETVDSPTPKTIMNQGAEANPLYDKKKYSLPRQFLRNLNGSTKYPDFHNPEYLFVSKGVRKSHVDRDKWDPVRKKKPEWDVKKGSGDECDLEEREDSEEDTEEGSEEDRERDRDTVDGTDTDTNTNTPGDTTNTHRQVLRVRRVN